MKKRIILFMMIIAVGCASLLCGCAPEREYNDDIVIPLAERGAEIVIKEWRFLLGSGAEVYYKVAGKETLLGKLPGGDDGFCPFKEGMYSVDISRNLLTVEWSFSPDSDLASRRQKTFKLPTKPLDIDDVIGLPSVEIIGKYGDFDLKVNSASPDLDGLYRECVCAYRIRKNMSFFGSQQEEYYFIGFDENGIATSCEYRRLAP